VRYDTIFLLTKTCQDGNHAGIVGGMTSDPGLRERKKQATRAALSRAAWALMVEQGIDAVTPEAVAEAVDVSPRTFRNYFASREEAILDWLAQRGEPVGDAIRARPASEPVWDSLISVVPEAVAEIIGSRDDMVALMRACRESPAMFAHHLVFYERGHWEFTRVIAERSGTDPRRDLAPRVMAAATTAVLKEAVDMWSKGDTDATLTELIREGLVQLRAGMPVGATPPPA
jgi:AcrR family transcriptional regulator